MLDRACALFRTRQLFSSVEGEHDRLGEQSNGARSARGLVVTEIALAVILLFTVLQSLQRLLCTVEGPVKPPVASPPAPLGAAFAIEPTTPAARADTNRYVNRFRSGLSGAERERPFHGRMNRRQLHRSAWRRRAEQCPARGPIRSQTAWL